MYSDLYYLDGMNCLSFECGDFQDIAALAPTGHIPNGSFWASVAEYLMPELCEAVELDPEANEFFAYGARDVLETLRDGLEHYLTHPELLPKLVREAETAGYFFDD